MALRKTRVTKIVRHPVDTFEIQLEIPNFRYRSGQKVRYICFGLLGYAYGCQPRRIHRPFSDAGSNFDHRFLARHPFTITSSPCEPYVSMHIRQFGDWTTDLARMVGCAAGEAIPAEITLPTFRVDGPFGAPASDVFCHETAVLIGAGIGVTPFASVLKTI
ncbi:MAG: hypothetical protein BJ554DRAFT_277 [Olpidium bornovanus]|uniref:FAD-binding FR-type domain-containing protein n=1 Tax=Olpidium bornovanus TaxID=278681 RepID=A0A8H7ZTZ1_9FUNG|nr:MAG: hypothetical protein BJ554DRAFT_277 [Olpidium bornovanus]